MCGMTSSGRVSQTAHVLMLLFVFMSVYVACFQWAREVGQKCDTPVKVPLHSCEHSYIITKPIQGIDNMMPGMYLQQHAFFRGDLWDDIVHNAPCSRMGGHLWQGESPFVADG